MKLLNQKLEQLRKENLFRQLQNNPHQEKTVNFNSNDYLGLSTHPLVVEAAAKGAEMWGVGSGGSRLLGKGLPLYQKWEQKLANVYHCDASLLFNSGYLANFLALKHLAPFFDCVFLDRLCHASLIDGVLASKTPLQRFPHLQLETLEQMLQKNKYKQNLVVVETIYSMDGDITDLDHLFELQQKYSFWVYIDQAHSFGAYPEILTKLKTKGDPQKKILMGAFGKAIGTCGGFITAPQNIIDYLINSAKGFIYSTALSPMIICATEKSFEISQTDSNLFQDLTLLIEQVQNIANDLKIPLTSKTHIQPILIGSSSKALFISKKLQEHHFLLQSIRPPTVPKGTERLRFKFKSKYYSYANSKTFTLTQRVSLSFKMQNEIPHWIWIGGWASPFSCFF